MLLIVCVCKACTCFISYMACWNNRKNDDRTLRKRCMDIGVIEKKLKFKFRTQTVLPSRAGDCHWRQLFLFCFSVCSLHFAKKRDRFQLKWIRSPRLSFPFPTTHTIYIIIATILSTTSLTFLLHSSSRKSAKKLGTRKGGRRRSKRRNSVKKVIILCGFVLLSSSLWLLKR